MRPDMAKVIVERPRIKGRAWERPKGYRRRLGCYGPDGPPGREGIKAPWQNGTKHLNEHLGPLRRYLDRQVGRPWDQVFSEICAHIDRSSAVQDHVRDHVEGYVETHVIVIEGVPAYAEDVMSVFRFGRVAIRGVKLCTRCAITTTDQEACTRDAAQEPLRTLKTYRYDRTLKGVVFGQNCVVEAGVGERLAAGDELAID